MSGVVRVTCDKKVTTGGPAGWWRAHRWGRLPACPDRACPSRVEAPRSRGAIAISEADAVGALDGGGAREHDAGHQSAGPRGRRSRISHGVTYRSGFFGNSIGREHIQPAGQISVVCAEPDRLSLSALMPRQDSRWQASEASAAVLVQDSSRLGAVDQSMTVRWAGLPAAYGASRRADAPAAGACVGERARGAARRGA